MISSMKAQSSSARQYSMLGALALWGSSRLTWTVQILSDLSHHTHDWATSVYS